MRTLPTAVLLAVAALGGMAPAAWASITYETEAGWLIPGLGGEGSISRSGSTPQMSFSGDFSFHGALCPAPGTQDYFCANVFAEATNTVEGLTLRASARAARHDATTLGVSYLTHGTARITMCNLSGSITTPASIAKFHIGLSGTTSTSSSAAGIPAQAFGVARFQGVPIQCAGTDVTCAPVTVPQFNPAGCTSLELRADAAFANQQSLTGWDATAVANFADTMTLLAIEGLDENGQPIPGLQFSATDAQGTPIITFPNTPPTSTTTTTAPAGATTTTTLPGGCLAAATYDSVRCRLDGLLAAIAAADAGALGEKLAARVTSSRAAVDRAQQSLGQRGGKTSRAALRKALKSLKTYGAALRSRKARRSIPEATRTGLGALLPALQADLSALSAATAG